MHIDINCFELSQYILKEYSDAKGVICKLFFPAENENEKSFIRFVLLGHKTVDIPVAIRGPFETPEFELYIRIHDMTKPAGNNLMSTVSILINGNAFNQLVRYAS